MPKHLLLFAFFLLLLIALFYHPVPDPEIWDADSRHIELPDYLRPVAEKPEEKTYASWPEKIKASIKKNIQQEVLSSIE